MGKGSMGKRRHILMLVWAGLFLGSLAHGTEDPDQLYQEGRYAEAEKIYARSDMDHPRDLRYRYNRGCADYQAGDYQGAIAAFTSVLRRSEDKEMQYRAAYNLGNAAFKQDDVGAAAEYYRQALRIDPSQEPARHNLEIALRKLEAQKKEKDPKDPQKEGEKEKGPEKPSADNPPEKGGEQEKTPDTEKAAENPEESGQQDEGKDSRKDQDRPQDEEPPKDLSGDLKPREALPERSEGAEAGQAAASAMDREKAEALLDNVTEDRAKLLRFQMPEGRQRGMASGKDW